MSTKMAGNVFTEVSDYSNLSISKPALTESSPCCDSHSHEHGEVKIPSIFDAVKSGLLIPVQTLVETYGTEILRSHDDAGHTAAHYACLNGYSTILKFIVDSHGAYDEPSHDAIAQHPIHWACAKGHIGIVDFLLQLGVSIEVADTKGCTPLVTASQYGQTMLVGYLIGKGASLCVTDREGDTALHWAAFKGHSELMRLLVYSGLNPRQLDHWHQTPLHLSCINGDFTSVRQLCELDKVDINLFDKNGKTPIMLATGRKHDQIVTYLQKQVKQRNSLISHIDSWSVIFGLPGSTKVPLLVMLLCLTCWGYPLYVFKCIPSTWNDLELLHISFLAVNVLYWISLYASATIDPGYLPRNAAGYDEAIKQAARFEDWREQGSSNPLSRLCHTCRAVKPLRTKHCRQCNRCVLTFDHHCPYVYNCVGLNNRHWFLVFTACIFAMCLMGDVFAVYMLQYVGWDWLIAVGLVVIVFFTGLSGFVLFFTLLQARQNITTNERINWSRYSYLQDDRGRFYNAFNLGWRRNCLEFFHLRRPLTEKDVEFLNVSVV